MKSKASDLDQRSPEFRDAVVSTDFDARSKTARDQDVPHNSMNAIKRRDVRTDDGGHRLRESQRLCRATVPAVDLVNP
jgi:hypothetical protein